MTQKEINLIKASWASVIPIAEEAGGIFYERLFSVAPELRQMFSIDITAQAKKLTDMITYVVLNLDKLYEILHDIKELGAKHKAYGTKPEHYQIVGECLIWTLKKGLGDDWNEELENAWATAYNVLADGMIAGQQN